MTNIALLLESVQNTKYIQVSYVRWAMFMVGI